MIGVGKFFQLKGASPDAGAPAPAATSSRPVGPTMTEAEWHTLAKFRDDVDLLEVAPAAEAQVIRRFLNYMGPVVPAEGKGDHSLRLAFEGFLQRCVCAPLPAAEEKAIDVRKISIEDPEVAALLRPYIERPDDVRGVPPERSRALREALLKLGFNVRPIGSAPKDAKGWNPDLALALRDLRTWAEALPPAAAKSPARSGGDRSKPAPAPDPVTTAAARARPASLDEKRRPATKLSPDLRHSKTPLR